MISGAGGDVEEPMLGRRGGTGCSTGPRGAGGPRIGGRSSRPIRTAVATRSAQLHRPRRRRRLALLRRGGGSRGRALRRDGVRGHHQPGYRLRPEQERQRLPDSAQLHRPERRWGIPTPGSPKATNGVLYGATIDGGTTNQGIVFRLDKDGSNYRVLREASGRPRTRWSALRPTGRGPDGVVYGTTAFGVVRITARCIA